MTATLTLSTMIEKQAKVPISEINLLALCINNVDSKNIDSHGWIEPIRRLEIFIEAVGSLEKVRVKFQPEYSPSFQSRVSRTATYFAYSMPPNRQAVLNDHIFQVRA